MLKETYKVAIENVCDLNEEEFIEVRRNSFGASDSSKLLGVNPFPNSSIENLMDEKVSGDFDDSISKKAIVRMGTDIEHIILKYCIAIIKVIHGEEYTIFKPKDMYVNDNFLSINFDGVAVKENTNNDFLFPVELKSTTYGRKYYQFDKACFNTTHGKLETDFRDVTKFRDILITETLEEYVTKGAEHYGIPVYYFTQIQQQMDAIENCEFGYLGVMDVNNWEVYLFKIFKHDEICKALNDNGSKYGNRMVTRINLKKSQ